jgi:DNA-binding response OmpR family regulator
MRGTSQHTVLIIDDDKVFCENESDILRSYGFEVMTTISPDDGIRIFSKDKVDIILLDYRFDGTSGIDIFQKMRALKDVPVVMVSAYCDPTVEDQFYSLGGELWMHKPFKTHELIQAISAILGSTNETMDEVVASRGE